MYLELASRRNPTIEVVNAEHHKGEPCLLNLAERRNNYEYYRPVCNQTNRAMYMRMDIVPETLYNMVPWHNPRA